MKNAETILVVDDDEDVLHVMVKLLKRLNYIVLDANSGRESVKIYEENKDKIDLVLLDVVMPDIGGEEVYDRIKKINPDVKVLLMSGWNVEGQIKALSARGCDAIIEKPFAMKDLSHNIRNILNKK